MGEDEIGSLFETYAQARDHVSLRAFRDTCCPSSSGLTPLLVSLLPTLSRMSMGWRGAGKDYQAFRIPGKKPFVLPGREVDTLIKKIGGTAALDRLEELTLEYIEHKTGKHWDDPVVLQRIRGAIMQQKGQYWSEADSRKIGYRKGYAVLAYLAYHAPVYVSQFQHAFLMLMQDGLVPGKARILDIGSGPGVVSLAISSLAKDIPGFSAELFSVERAEEFLESYRFLVNRLAGDTPQITAYPPIVGDLRDTGALPLPSAVDLIVLQNVTNELVEQSPEKRAPYLRRLASLLAPQGCIAVIEPAERQSAVALRKMVRAAIGHDLQVHSPCTPLWGEGCAADACWSFITKPAIRPTRLMTALSGTGEGFRFTNTDIKFSYAVLVKDRRRRQGYSPGMTQSFSHLSSLKGRIGRKVNVAASLMSGDIGDKRTHVFLICDGSSRQPVYLVLPRFHISPENRDLLLVPYSHLIEIYGALVRFNQKHAAWNLFLTKGSKVIPVRQGSSEIVKGDKTQ